MSLNCETFDSKTQCRMKVHKNLPYTLAELKKAYRQHYKRPVPSFRPRFYVCQAIETDPDFCNFLKQQGNVYRWKRRPKTATPKKESPLKLTYKPETPKRKTSSKKESPLKLTYKPETPKRKTSSKKESPLKLTYKPETPKRKTSPKKESPLKLTYIPETPKRKTSPKKESPLKLTRQRKVYQFPSLDLPFDQYQESINKQFAQFRYPVPEFTSGCIRKPGELLKFAPHQDFIRHYLQPRAPHKGLLVWHDAGTGKTCASIGILSHQFESNDYDVLWVTRRKIQDAPLKAMFRDVCHSAIRQLIKEGKKEMSEFQKSKMKQWQDYFKLYAKWGKGGLAVRNLTYKEFGNTFNPASWTSRRKTLGWKTSSNPDYDPLKKTLIVVDEAHNLYNLADLPVNERIGENIKFVEQAIHKSYRVSGEDSVRLVLLTATPILNDPTSLPKLINLIQHKQNLQLPTTIDGLNREFSGQSGLNKFRESVKGLISYFTGSADVRYFAKKDLKQIIDVTVTEIQQDAIDRCLGKEVPKKPRPGGGWTIAKLKAECKKKGIKGYSKWKREELMEKCLDKKTSASTKLPSPSSVKPSPVKPSPVKRSLTKRVTPSTKPLPVKRSSKRVKPPMKVPSVKSVKKPGLIQKLKAKQLKNKLKLYPDSSISYMLEHFDCDVQKDVDDIIQQFDLKVPSGYKNMNIIDQCYFLIKLWPQSCIIDGYKPIRFIAKGTQGSIYLACQKRNCEYIMKVSKLYDEEDKQQWLNEVKLQKMAAGFAPQVIRSHICYFGGLEYGIMIMEKMDGDLRDLIPKLIKQGKKGTVLQLFKQSLVAIKALNNQLKIGHRDLHLGNVFYKKTKKGYLVKIGDFGFAYHASLGSDNIDVYDYKLYFPKKGNIYYDYAKFLIEFIEERWLPVEEIRKHFSTEEIAKINDNLEKIGVDIRL